MQFSSSFIIIVIAVYICSTLWMVWALVPTWPQVHYKIGKFINITLLFWYLALGIIIEYGRFFQRFNIWKVLLYITVSFKIHKVNTFINFYFYTCSNLVARNNHIVVIAESSYIVEKRWLNRLKTAECIRLHKHAQAR